MKLPSKKKKLEKPTFLKHQNKENLSLDKMKLPSKKKKKNLEIIQSKITAKIKK